MLGVNRDKDFLDAINELWKEAFEAKKSTRRNYLPSFATEEEKMAYARSDAREQALWEAFEIVSKLVVKHCDDVLNASEGSR